MPNAWKAYFLMNELNIKYEKKFLEYDSLYTFTI
jgi:hypothetical protein